MNASQVPGLVTEEQGEWLAEHAAEGIALEIGSFRGRSTCFLASRANFVIACEPFTGQPHPPRPGRHKLDFAEVRNSFFRHLAKCCVAERVRVVERRSSEAYSEILEEFACTIDLVFADGSHYMPDLVVDVCFANMVRLGGIIAFHDYGHDDFPDVKEAVDHWFAFVEGAYEEIVAPENMRAFRKKDSLVVPHTWFETWR